MKKFLFAVLVSCLAIVAITAPTVEVNAQAIKRIDKVITTADTTYFLSVPSKIKSFSFGLTKTSGTVAGKAILEGGVLAGQWVAIDSLTLADVTTLQAKTTILTATTYLNYRYRCTNTSSATAVIKAAYLRRADE